MNRSGIHGWRPHPLSDMSRRWLKLNRRARLQSLLALPTLMSSVVLSACGGSVASPTAHPSPPARQMEISMSGAIAGPFLLETGADQVVCASPLTDDRRSVNYIFKGNVESARPDIGVALNFAVHSYVKPGMFGVGTYPSGSPESHAIAVVVLEITDKHILTWVSGSGSLVIDPGAHSGTLYLHLISSGGVGDLFVLGSWACPLHA